MTVPVIHPRFLAMNAAFLVTRAVVFTKPDGTTTTAQDVQVEWAGAPGAQRHIAPAAGADRSMDADLSLWRLSSDGFEVEKGDRFEIDGEKAVVTRVFRTAVAIVASCRLVTGTVWPS